MNDYVKRDLDYIKLENPEDYKCLLIAGKIYTDNKNSDNKSDILERSMLAVVRDLLDKHGVKYIDDLL